MSKPKRSVNAFLCISVPARPHCPSGLSTWLGRDKFTKLFEIYRMEGIKSVEGVLFFVCGGGDWAGFWEGVNYEVCWDGLGF